MIGPAGTNGVKLAGEEAKDKMYEPKQNKKLVRVLTVIVYVFSVSLAAIILSLYYIFFYGSPHKSQELSQQSYQSPPGCIDDASGETPKVLPQREDTTPSFFPTEHLQGPPTLQTYI